MAKQLLKFSFSGTLKAVLVEHRITQYKLAQISGLDPGHVSRLVRGLRTRPNGKTMQVITLALARLGVSDSDISRVQSSAGFSGFDITAESIEPKVEAHARSDRQDLPEAATVDLSTITFEVADPPPPSATRRTKPPVVVPTKLNMGKESDMAEFKSKLDEKGTTLPPARIS